jgi:antitoxin component YwqK of YwqJK toxin-antitoxin module
MKTQSEKRKTQKVMTRKPVPVKKSEIIDGYTIKYHANGKTIWSKGKIVNGQTEGYWEWYRPDGTLKRSGYFDKGEPVGEWTTYDEEGNVYKVERKKAVNTTNNNEGIFCPTENSETSSSTE